MNRRTCLAPRLGRIALAPAALAGIFALAACATAPIGADISDVQSTVSERLARGAPSLAQLHLHWNQGTAEDEEVAGEVRAMLRDELSASAAVQIALLNNRNLQATYEELGIAQALWVFEVENFGPFLVESDAKGNSLFERNNRAMAARIDAFYQDLKALALHRYGETDDRKDELI